jgi:hypothetical protein
VLAKAPLRLGSFSTARCALHLFDTAGTGGSPTHPPEAKAEPKLTSRRKVMSLFKTIRLGLLGALAVTKVASIPAVAQQAKKPNIVILMSDDTGWNDLGVYLGGANLGHPTPNLDRLAKEGATAKPVVRRAAPRS